jgi:hypothetical protein
MVRRLAEATNAWRTRRTRGETGLRRFRWLACFAVPLPAVFADGPVPVEAFAELVAELLLLGGLAEVAAAFEAGGVSEDAEEDAGDGDADAVAAVGAV